MHWRPLWVLGLALAALVIGAGPASGQTSPQPLSVANLSPADGGSIEATDDPVTFSANVVAPNSPQPSNFYWVISETTGLDENGFLVSTGFGPTGNTHAMDQSPTDPTFYSVAPVHRFRLYEGTYYWQISHSQPVATSPVYTLNVTPAPPFLDVDYALEKIKEEAAQKTRALLAGFKSRCKRKSDTQLTCETSWRTKRTGEFSYAGTWTVKVIDDRGFYDDILLRFKGERATKECLKEERSFDACAKPLKPWSDTACCDLGRATTRSRPKARSPLDGGLPMSEE